jgi:hypothetical protein
MKLPNAESAVVDIAKLRDYCLSPTHYRGRNKARVFQAALGITKQDAAELLAVLMRAAREGDAVEGASDAYGTRYIIDFELTWSFRTAMIRSSWIIPANEISPRLLTCYVL